MKNLPDHWNDIYIKSDENKLGWYETDYSQTIKFLNLISGWKKSKIFVSGAGTSDLIDVLLKSNAILILNDLSSEAIKLSKQKYDNKKHNIQWMCHDISKPISTDLKDIDIWIDRAVLHFLVDDRCVSQYFKNLNRVVKSGGYALFAEFSKSGATRCAGLDVRRYDIHDFEKNLTAFQLISTEEYTYVNPNGEPRPYIYALFKKNMPDETM